MIFYIQLYIIATFFFSVLYGGLGKGKKLLLQGVLLTGATSEVCSIILKKNGYHLDILYTFYFTISCSLWLVIITKIMYDKKAVGVMLTAFLLFAVLNFLFFEGLKCNFNTFIVGALLYIVIFITTCFKRLKNEDFKFFSSNDFLLIATPVLLNFFLSFAFGFKSEELAMTKIFGIKLYHILSFVANFSYYTMANIYIYRDKKLNHA